MKRQSLPQHQVHTLGLMERLPKGADEKQVWQNKAFVERQMLKGAEASTSGVLPELRPDPKVKRLH